MATLITTIAAAGLIVLIELPSLLKKKLKKELWLFLVLLLFGTGLSLAKGFHAAVPNPLDWMAFALKPFSDFLFGLMK